MVELTKWPTLLVKGRTISPEQAELVIIRTSWLAGLHKENNRWSREVRRAFQIQDMDNYRQWEKVAARLGVLDLEYLHNDQLLSCYVGGPRGWCNWAGHIGSAGMSLTGKWPEVGEVHEEWTNLAHAFPFLHLSAQLVHREWDYSTQEPLLKQTTPLVTWDVGNGAAEMRTDPGPLLREIRDDVGDEALQRMTKPGGDLGAHWTRVRSAVRRCERAAQEGI